MCQNATCFSLPDELHTRILGVKLIKAVCGIKKWQSPIVEIIMFQHPVPGWTSVEIRLQSTIGPETKPESQKEVAFSDLNKPGEMGISSTQAA